MWKQAFRNVYPILWNNSVSAETIEDRFGLVPIRFLFDFGEPIFNSIFKKR